MTAESSAPLTCRFSVFGKLYFTPLHRSSSATEPVCWMVQRILVAPSAIILLPACCPARNSSEEKWVSAPACCQ